MNNTTGDHECVYESDDPYAELKLFNFMLTIIISIFGLIGNSLVIMINRKAKNVSSTDIYITWIAITDNLLIVSMNTYSYRYVYPVIFPHISDWRSSGIFTLTGILLTHFVQQANTYIIVLLSIDRYIQVRHSAAVSQRWCTKRRAAILVCGACALSFIYSLPRFWEYVPLIVNFQVSIDRCFGYFMFTHGIGTNKHYKLLYSFVFYLVVMYAVPLTILTFTNYVLIRTILKRRVWRRKILPQNSSMQVNDNSDKVRRRTEYRAILTLIIVMLSFMVLQIPDISLNFIWRFSPEYGPTASIFAYQLMIVNSSVNFIIYAVSSRVFKKRLITVLVCMDDQSVQSREETMLGRQAVPTCSTNHHTEEKPYNHDKTSAPADVNQKSHTITTPHV